jgi:hypothetical protein
MAEREGLTSCPQLQPLKLRNFCVNYQHSQSLATERIGILSTTLEK